jgi:uncharacterized protein YndB with AHSA1/START domain
MSETQLTKEGNVLLIERTINASRDKVWDAYTTPELFAKWWGPNGWDTVVPHMDFAPGGYMLYGMKCNDESQGEWYGQTSWGKMVYETIEPKTSFTYVDYFCDAEGNVDEAMPQTTITMMFEEIDGTTRMTSKGVYANEAALDQVMAMGMEPGIRQTIDRLVVMVEA